MPTETETIIQISPGILEQLDERVDTPWVVILYNCDCHSYEEVIFQVQKATGCSLEKADWITHEAHITGRAVTFTGPLDDCERVMTILRAIKLQVELDKA
ncbi:MAG: Clp protease ClpS [Armatimonadetes bacterium]|jgi:ATP-dependent Clp protease adapter protein ClpS|nr:Clp protease ClpS [Armatimonadota bacterium]